MTPAAKFPLRVSRGLAFAVVALALAAGAHVIGGGSAPGLLVLAILAVPVVWGSLFLTMARRRRPTVVGALVLAQVVLHEGFRVLSGSAVGAEAFVSPSTMSSGPGMVGHAAAMGVPAPVIPVSEGMTMAAPGLSMFGAHLVATVLTGVVLAHGEDLLWNLWTWLRRSIVAPAVPVRVFPRPRGVSAWAETANLVPAIVDRSVRRRGPPGVGFRLPLFV